jgi:hypothetical protein
MVVVKAQDWSGHCLRIESGVRQKVFGAVKKRPSDAS